MKTPTSNSQTSDKYQGSSLAVGRVVLGAVSGRVIGQPNMPKPVIRGLKVVEGVREPRPIHGAPPGRMRLRMRNFATAKVFVKTDAGVRCFLLEDRGEYWFCSPRLEQGRNATMWRGRNGSEGTDGLQASELESAKQAVLEARGIEPGAED